MPYTRPAIVSGVTKLHKAFFENLFDGVDEKLSVEDANATYAPSSGSSNYAQVVALGAGSGTDDTTALNAILAGASGKVVRGRHGENYQISAPIIVPSGVTLDMTGCTVTLKASSNCNMLRNAAFASLRSATLTTTVDSTTVTAVSGFTSADIGRSVVIPGAGPGGLVFTAVITAVASGTSFTISKAAKTAVSAVASTVHVRDKNIAIIGGTWDRGANNGTDNDRMSLMFRRIDGLRISGITYLSTAGKYGLNIADCNDFWVVNPRFVCSSDGVHLIGPCTGGHISGVRGTLGDDAVSLTAVDYTTYNDVVGDIVGIEISDVVASTPTTSLIKFTSADGVLVDKVHCRGLTQLIPTRPTFTFANDTGNVNMGDIYMSQVVGRGSISAGSIKSLTIADWVWDATSNTNIALDIYASVDNLRIRGVTGRHGAYTDAHLVALRGTGTIKALQLSDVDFEGTGINCAVVYFGNVATTVGTLDVSHVRRKGPTGNSSVIDARNTANVITALLLSDILTDGTAWIADLNGTTKVNFANIRALTGGSFNIRAAAVLDISGSGMSTNLYAAITSGASVRSRSFDFGVDVSLLARNNNDRVYNSNGALACGSGPVLCGDTPTFTWKHLHTGATYT
jgi:hypothetical protein